MTPEFVQIVGYVSLAALVVAALILAVGLVYMVLPGRDDGYRFMGDPAAPPERRSPFAPKLPADKDK